MPAGSPAFDLLPHPGKVPMNNIELKEDQVVEVEYWTRREGGDPHIKKVIGQVVNTSDPFMFVLGDVGRDIGATIPIYYDRVLGIEHLPHPEEVEEITERSWRLLNTIPVSQPAAVDQIIKLTQLVQVLSAEPVSDQ